MLLGPFIHAAVIAFLIAFGISYTHFTKDSESDSKVEELTEHIAEQELERLFRLEDGYLKGSLDFSPSSKEQEMSCPIDDTDKP